MNRIYIKKLVLRCVGKADDLPPVFAQQECQELLKSWAYSAGVRLPSEECGLT